VAAGAGALLHRFGPESMGGVGDFGARIDAEIARTGLSEDEISHKVRIFILYFYSESPILYAKIFYHTEGKLIQIPGQPAMYDYEFFPQKV
jgi:hypothetical protein